MPIKNCEVCQKEYTASKHALPKRRACSVDCGHKLRNKHITVTCAQCSTPFSIRARRLKLSKSGLVFCSRLCKERASSYGGHLERGTGKYSYRERALSEYGSSCNSCGYDTDARMLDVDHVDSDRGNNKISNLRVLCVWCHALKTRQVRSHHRGAPEEGIKRERSANPRPTKIHWPSDEELEGLLWEQSAVQVAKALGVSSTAIKKRCLRRGIQTRPIGYWAKVNSPTNKPSRRFR